MISSTDGHNRSLLHQQRQTAQENLKLVEESRVESYQLESSSQRHGSIMRGRGESSRQMKSHLEFQPDSELDHGMNGGNIDFERMDERKSTQRSLPRRRQIDTSLFHKLTSGKIVKSSSDSFSRLGATDASNVKDRGRPSGSLRESKMDRLGSHSAKPFRTASLISTETAMADNHLPSSSFTSSRLDKIFETDVKGEYKFNPKFDADYEDETNVEILLKRINDEKRTRSDDRETRRRERRAKKERKKARKKARKLKKKKRKSEKRKNPDSGSSTDSDSSDSDSSSSSSSSDARPVKRSRQS